MLKRSDSILCQCIRLRQVSQQFFTSHNVCHCRSTFTFEVDKKVEQESDLTRNFRENERPKSDRIIVSRLNYSTFSPITLRIDHFEYDQYEFYCIYFDCGEGRNGIVRNVDEF